MDDETRTVLRTIIAGLRDHPGASDAALSQAEALLYQQRCRHAYKPFIGPDQPPAPAESWLDAQDGARRRMAHRPHNRQQHLVWPLRLGIVAALLFAISELTSGVCRLLL